MVYLKELNQILMSDVSHPVFSLDSAFIMLLDSSELISHFFGLFSLNDSEDGYVEAKFLWFIEQINM